VVGVALDAAHWAAQSDVVTIHMTLNEANRGFLGAAQFKQMRPTAYLVNCARGALVDEQALYDAVEAGTIAGAAIDVFSVEPAAFKPTALVLNILVAAVATYSFARAGHFSWSLFWPFAATSIPCSFMGGYLSLSPHLYNPL